MIAVSWDTDVLKCLHFVMWRKENFLSFSSHVDCWMYLSMHRMCITYVTRVTHDKSSIQPCGCSVTHLSLCRLFVTALALSTRLSGRKWEEEEENAICLFSRYFFNQLFLVSFVSVGWSNLCNLTMKVKVKVKVNEQAEVQFSQMTGYAREDALEWHPLSRMHELTK